MTTSTTRRWPGFFVDKGGAGFTLTHPDFGGADLAVDGSDDWSTVLAAASTFVAAVQGSLIIGPGVYGVANDVTLACPVTFMTGARLVPASGMTVTFEQAPICVGFHLDPTEDGDFAFESGIFPYFAPEWFGAVGDGVTDDYEAWEALKRAVNSNGKAVIEFQPSAVYRIDRYYDSVAFPDNISTPWQNLTSLYVRGNGAKIDLKADFERSASVTRATLLPFSLRFSDNIIIEGLELDGNVQDMTREAGLGEGSGNYGVEVYDCNNITFRNMWVHHFATDGILLGIENLCYNIRLDQVRCTNNARQGMSIISAREVYCTRCEFNDTGRDTGAYGAHSPGGGVDIEPDFIPNGGYCGDIVFEHCQFRNNVAQFYSSEPFNVERVVCRDCEFESLDGDPSFQVIAASKGVHFERCKFFLDSGHILAGFAEPGDLDLQWITFRDCEIHSSGEGMISDIDVLVELDNVKFFNTATEPSALYSPYLNNPQMVTRNCRVFRPAESYNGAGSYHVCTLWQVRKSINTDFVTDLDPSVEGAGAHFATQYTNATGVQGDRFLPTTNQAFRPSFNSDHPAGARYDQESLVVHSLGLPAAQTGTINDFNVGANAEMVRFLLSANVTLTGISGGHSGRGFHLQNTDNGVRTLTLKHNDAGSTAGNRFMLPGGVDYVLNPGEGCFVWYDHLSGAYRVSDKA